MHPGMIAVEMKRILLIASTTGYQTQLFLEAAERLHVEVVLASDRCHVLDDPWRDHAIPVRFEDPASAVRAAALLSVDGIVALGDRPAGIAAVIAQELGIAYNAPEAVSACRNKFVARQKFAGAGLPVPEFWRVTLEDDPEAAARRATYPSVLKPLGLSASRGVIRADSAGEFVVAFKRIRKLLCSAEIVKHDEPQDRFIQIERFIPGREFALEGVVSGGRLRILAIFDKPDPLDGPFFEETIYVTPSREDPVVLDAIAKTATLAVAALGLTEGPVHAEMRVNGEGVWMLEVAARPIGGLCARVLPGLPEFLVRHALGEDMSDVRLDSGGAGVMMIPIPRAGVYEGVWGLEQAQAVAGIGEVVITAKPQQQLTPLPEGSSYLGFIFASGGNPAEVEGALRQAHAVLRFEIGVALPVLAI